MTAAEVVLQLPELMDKILGHLSTRELVWTMPLVSRAWRHRVQAKRHQQTLHFTGCGAMIPLAARRVPFARSLDLDPPNFLFSRVADFRALETLNLNAASLLPRSYRVLRQLRKTLTSLTLFSATPEGLLAMVQGPATHYDGLKELDLRMCATHSLHERAPAAVLRLAAGLPALQRLRLRNTVLAPLQLDAVLLSAPLRVLELWLWDANTRPACLDSMANNGGRLEAVVFTVCRAYDFIEYEEPASATREKYVEAAFNLFAACPQLKTLRLRNAQSELQTLAAVRHLRIGPNVRVSVKLCGGTVELRRHTEARRTLKGR